MKENAHSSLEETSVNSSVGCTDSEWIKNGVNTSLYYILSYYTAGKHWF